MTEPFKLCILFGDKPDIRPPEQIGSAWDMCEIPVALQVQPFESEANWAAKKPRLNRGDCHLFESLVTFFNSGV